MPNINTITLYLYANSSS